MNLEASSVCKCLAGKVPNFPEPWRALHSEALWRTSEAPSERSIKNSARLCDRGRRGGRRRCGREWGAQSRAVEKVRRRSRGLVGWEAVVDANLSLKETKTKTKKESGY